jgi:hypothetical protein
MSETQGSYHTSQIWFTLEFFLGEGEGQTI